MLHALSGQSSGTSMETSGPRQDHVGLDRMSIPETIRCERRHECERQRRHHNRSRERPCVQYRAMRTTRSPKPGLSPGARRLPSANCSQPGSSVIIEPAPSATVPIVIQSTARLRPIRAAPSVINSLEKVPLTRPHRNAACHALLRRFTVRTAALGTLSICYFQGMAVTRVMRAWV